MSASAKPPENHGYVEAENLRTCWLMGAFLAIVDTTILVFTGSDNFLQQMKSLPWREAAGLTYFLFLLPWYVTIMGSIALTKFPRQDHQVLLPHDSRTFHLLNLFLLGPCLLLLATSTYPILIWAFSPEPSTFDWIVIFSALVMIQYFLLKKSWSFITWTTRALFAGR